MIMVYDLSLIKNLTVLNMNMKKKLCSAVCNFSSVVGLKCKHFRSLQKDKLETHFVADLFF